MDDVISYIGASLDPGLLAYYGQVIQFRSIIIKKRHVSGKQLKSDSFFQPTRSRYLSAIKQVVSMLPICRFHQVKVKLSIYRPWRSLGLREVEAPTFSDIRLIDGGKVVSPTRRPLFTRRTFPGTHFCWRLSRPQGHNAAGRIR
jgi:hypothetical protein